MKPETFKEIQAQREENAQWLRCKVEPILQGVSRPAAMAVFEVGVDMDGVDITQWAFFAQADGAAQARPGTGINDPESEPETESGSDSEGAAPGAELDCMRNKLAQVQARL